MQNFNYKIIFSTDLGRRPGFSSAGRSAPLRGLIRGGGAPQIFNYKYSIKVIYTIGWT